ncbi:MAG: hypothetical protein PWP48_399 [Clostridiales bacterium]|nr:hypothetical protein [Clostridiales bacterium]MDK2991166.1 hypothetical protein [Clostridiales bacterium]
MMSDNLSNFIKQMNELKDVLEPQPFGNGGKKIAKPSMVKKVATIIGVKTTASRFIPVSHEGYSTDTYIDRVDIFGVNRAEFIGRKQKGIERRAHMTMFRELLENMSGQKWEDVFKKYFGDTCIIPDDLCLACWNCSLFGGLEAGKGAVFSRIRYFDTYSIEPAEFAVAMEGSEEGMAIGNTVSENLSAKRGSDSYHQYEYVKAGTHFPFIAIIENPTLLDVIGYIRAVRIADNQGYGKYSANHGKFDTQFLAVSTGYPRFSVLDMIEWAGEDYSIKNVLDMFNGKKPGVEFDTVTDVPIALYGDEIDEMAQLLSREFKMYFEMLKG